MAVTSIEQLTTMAQGEEVELPAFAEEQTFIARLRRPSLYALVKAGKIPNSLLASASKVFDKKEQGNQQNKEQGKQQNISEFYDALEAVCEASFVEPKYADIKEAGIQLTDEQMMAVFTYSQEGVKGLSKFRTVGTNSERAGDVEAVSETPVGNTEYL